VVEIVPARLVEVVSRTVVEMVPVLVVEMVPVLVVEMVPDLVVEMVPLLANVGVYNTDTKTPVQIRYFRFFMVRAPGDAIFQCFVGFSACGERSETDRLPTCSVLSYFKVRANRM